MASYNRVVLVGNVTRDPQVKYTQGGTAVAEIGLAVSRQWFDKATNSRKDETTFVDVTVWGKTAEHCGEYLAKGRPVLVEARLQTDSWEDKDTGQKRSKLKVVAENVTFLGSGEKRDRQPERESTTAEKAGEVFGDGDDFSDVPF